MVASGVPAPPLRTWPATQACALSGNRTSDPLVHRPMLNPQIHTSQGSSFFVVVVQLQLSPFPPSLLSPALPSPTFHIQSFPPLSLSMGLLYMFLDKLNIYFLYDPAVLLLGIFSKAMKLTFTQKPYVIIYRGSLHNH